MVSSAQAAPIVLNSNVGYFDTKTTSDSNTNDDDAKWMTMELSKYSVVTTPCGTVKVALLGLLSDEAGMFRDGTFRGVSIHNVLDTFRQLHHDLVVQENNVADWILPLTHASITRDEELGRYMPTIQPGPNIILGGHEHVPYDVTVHPTEDTATAAEDDYTRILKAGTDAMGVSLLDIYFDVGEEEESSPDTTDHDTTTHQQDPNSNKKQVKVKDIEYQLIDIRALTPSMVVQNIVDQHESILKAMENEDVLHADPLLPPGELLSSEGTRIQQTTLGGIFCTCIKEELETDVAILNGAVIKGNTTYTKPALTYSQMKAELPFPTKIVIVTMKRWELQEAIEYSRTCPMEGDEETEKDNGPTNAPIERRGYLQVDLQYNHYGFHTGDHDDELSVALPRNLLNGFCKIKPLMEVGKRLKEEGIFPEADEFIPAIDLVIRHSSKERWYELIHDNYTFADLDPDAKGYLSRADVERILTAAIHHRPPDFLIDDMMSAIDFDDNGIIDPGELSHLLAVMEREHGVFRFDD
jgi:hypothetical protein